MYHKQRWTSEKIKQRLELIAPLVYIRRKLLHSFRYMELENALTPPQIGTGVDDSDWQEISANEYWGMWMQNFVMRTRFVIPEEWDKTQPIALYLPLGEAGDFSHPEALAYLDGKPYAACDRHHQEILLNPEWLDGQTHLLALHGWTGLRDFGKKEPFSKLYMSQCAVVQIHQPTRDFMTLARIGLETIQNISDDHPSRYGLLSALNEAFLLLDTRDPLDCETFYESVEPALQALRTAM